MWPTSDEPAHWNYWRREALAYETGLAATAYAGAGITAPALLQASPRPDGGVELWLADVGGTGGFDWPVPRLARFARELGAGQARWAGRVPAYPVAVPPLAGAVPRRQGRNGSGRVEAADWDHPNLTRLARPVRTPAAAAMGRPGPGARRRRSAERTLCHLDVWPANLIDDAGTSVLLDWAFTGEGAVGEDIANLIVDSFTDGLMDVALLPELAEAATDGYLAGLRDGGWTGSATRCVPRSTPAAPPSTAGSAPPWPAAPPAIPRPVLLPPGHLGRRGHRRLTPLVTLIADWAGWT